MKKSILSLALLSLLAGLSGCGDDNKYGWGDQTYNIQTKSLGVVLPTNTSEDPYFLSSVIFKFSQSLDDGKFTVSTVGDISLGAYDNLSFTSPATTPTGNTTTVVIQPLPFESKSGQTVKLDSRITSQYWYYNSTDGQYTSNPTSVPYGTFNISKVTVNDDYVIKTFQEKCVYVGSTSVGRNGSVDYTTSTTFYQVEINIDTKKATVYIYNAKFADAMPIISVMRLRNLDLTASRSNGYQISGENVVPQIQEGSNWVDNEQFTFNKFILAPSSDNLSYAAISFQVANAYNATFSGTYIIQ